MRQVDRAYLAGVIDGEGSISICGVGKRYKNGLYPNYRLSIEVMNTNEELIVWLYDRCGGNIYKRNRSGNRKDIFVWQIGSRKTLPVLELVLPYLKVKREVAMLALDFGETYSVLPEVNPYGRNGISDETWEKRLEIAEKAQELNRRGRV